MVVIAITCNIENGQLIPCACQVEAADSLIAANSQFLVPKTIYIALFPPEEGMDC